MKVIKNNFNHYDHMFVYIFSIKPTKEDVGSINPFETNTKYCHYDEAHNDYLFKEEWNAFIISNITSGTLTREIWKSNLIINKLEISTFWDRIKDIQKDNLAEHVFIKKQKHSENLIDWFRKMLMRKLLTVRQNYLMFRLIIDDEADAASVNASKSIDDIKTINKLIRTLLNLFKSNTHWLHSNAICKLVYFARAQWWINNNCKNKEYKIEDLFPRDSIINIKAPTNYIGAAKIFGFENPNGETKRTLDIFRHSMITIHHFSKP